MSAPYQLWLIGPNDDPPTWTADDLCVSYSGSGVRYLRADLTCGKCKLFTQTKEECPHWHDDSERCFPTGPKRDSPACMAFEARS